MSNNPPLAIDSSPSLFARLAVYNNDGTAIFRLPAKGQCDYDSTAPKFEGRRPKLLSESNELVGVCIDTDSNDEDGTIDLHFTVDDPTARAKLASGTLLGINIPIKTAGREAKGSGQYTCIPIGACRLTDSASRTVILPTEKMFKVVNERGKVEKRPFVTGNGVGSDSIAMIKAAHARGAQHFGPDTLTKGTAASLPMDSTAQAISTIHAGSPTPYAGAIPRQSSNDGNRDVRADQTLEGIKAAQRNPQRLRG